jgi:hypothetical protein
MTNFARIINNVAVDVSTDPTNSFHPSIAAEFVEVHNTVISGSTRDSEGIWSLPAPTILPLAVLIYPTIGPIAFKMLFTAQERVSAHDLEATDKILASFWRLIDDPRTNEVDLSLKTVQGAVEYTLNAIKTSGVAVDVPTRLAAILSGVLK